MAKRVKKAKPKSKQRASWRGYMTFGLVSFEVEAFNALDREQSDIHFHQLHAECHSRVKYQKVCPVHGEISNDEIVSGYEYRKGKYVEIDPDELDALRTEREKALTVDAFVSPETVDPLYFDGRMYYLLPKGEAAQDSYVVIATAMQREERYGVGRVVFSGKDQIVLVRPLEGILHMAMLNYEDEIRPPEKFAHSLKRASGLTRQLRLAQTLIRDWTDDNFDFGKYEDRYREKVEELIEAKVKGHDVVVPEAEEQPEEVVSLMEALKESLERERPKRRRRRSA